MRAGQLEHRHRRGTVARLIGLGMFTGAMTVGIATRGRHPGWLAMLLVALLIEASR